MIEVKDDEANMIASAEIERLRAVEDMAKAVLKTFLEAEAAGYRSRDRQYAIELLGKFIHQQSTGEHTK